MSETLTKRANFLYGLKHFFPFQLLVLHLQRNHLLLFLWFVLFGFTNGFFGVKFGVPYLFFSAEYLERVGFLAFLIVGFSVGGFVMAFNTYSYLILGPRFPFLATLSRPFIKFCTNNSLIPLVFMLLYSMRIYSFQTREEFASPSQSLLMVLSLWVGVILFVSISLLYFFNLNKNVPGLRERSRKKGEKGSPVGTTLHREDEWDLLDSESTTKDSVYIGRRFRFMRARSVEHYEPQLIRQVFAQNHVNASIFEVAMIISFFVLGLFRESPVFLIPAAASIMLLFTIFLMLISAFRSWLRKWAFSTMLALLLLFNWVAPHIELLQFISYCYGLDYDSAPLVYNDENVRHFQNDTIQNLEDLKVHMDMLDSWSQSVASEGEGKPKLVLMITSGGGLRSSFWTFRVMQELQARTDGRFMRYNRLITGASGGMVGAAYFRELYLRSLSDTSVDVEDKHYAEVIGKDLLNPIAVTIATNDIFVRYQRYDDGKYSYIKDRGFAFERQLVQNSDGLMTKRLMDYVRPEREGEIPMMVLSPTILNDGRRLVVSPLPMGFLHLNKGMAPDGLPASTELVEFSRYFAKREAMEARFTSLLRMNATFPYILPVVSLPSEPRMEIMDAGIRDNYGVRMALDYLMSLSDWINENTSGVVIVQMRDTKKDYQVEASGPNSLIENIVQPFGAVYGNFPRIQDYDLDQLFTAARSNFAVDVEVVAFNMRANPYEPIALSWHLTANEKRKIQKAIQHPENQKAFERIEQILK